MYNQDKPMSAESPDLSHIVRETNGHFRPLNVSKESSLSNPKYADNKSHPVHRWVNWIAGFSWKFAGDVIDRYIPLQEDRKDALILDPFAGVGTTLIESQRRGIRTLGYEINPYAQLAARAKLEAALVDPA